MVGGGDRMTHAAGPPADDTKTGPAGFAHPVASRHGGCLPTPPCSARAALPLIGCYRHGAHWVHYSAADLQALLRLADDRAPVELVAAGEGDTA